jgi:hypothetical protein
MPFRYRSFSSTSKPAVGHQKTLNKEIQATVKIPPKSKETPSVDKRSRKRNMEKQLVNKELIASLQSL